MVDLTAYLLTEALPFSTSLNADLTGSRLLYTERNFGELDFIENPLQLVLLPSVDTGSSFVKEDEVLLDGLSKGDATSRIQLLRVREKHHKLQELRRQRQQGRQLDLDRLLTTEVSAEFRNRLRSYKEQRQQIVEQLRAGGKPAIVKRLRALADGFEAYVRVMLGGNRILFRRLLQLHLALLSAHACADDEVGNRAEQPKAGSKLLCGSCSLLTPWGAASPKSSPESLASKGLRWFWDLILGLTSRRAAYYSSLPLGDAASLRLSAAVDQLVRSSSETRARGIAAAAVRRRACIFSGGRLSGARSCRQFSEYPFEAGNRHFLHGVFAAASDRLLREACIQLRSPRREQQREEMNQLFSRGVASEPAEASAFAELDGNLQVICSLVESCGVLAQGNAPTTVPLAPGSATTAAGYAARALADSWKLVEILETKAWVITRTFDVVTGRLAKEKLLSSFASEQRESRRGIGQWTCQGWKGPTENRLYLNHLCILLVTLFFIGFTALMIIFAFWALLKATARAVRRGVLLSRVHDRVAYQRPWKEDDHKKKIVAARPGCQLRCRT